MSRRVDRRALFASGTAAALLASVGMAAGSSPQCGGTLGLAVSGGDRSDSWARGDGLFMQVARQGLVFDTLTEIAADGTLRGELATGWTSNANATVWRFDLRQDVIFHDGMPFTSADVVASAAGFEDGFVQADGPCGVIFTLHTPDTGLPFRLSAPEYYIAPAHALGQGVGTGLYQATHFIPGQRLIADRVPHHYKDGLAGWFDRVELVSIPSADVRAQAVLEHLVDAADVPAPITPGPFATYDSGMLLSQSIAAHPTTDTKRPFDNLRAAERWWRA